MPCPFFMPVEPFESTEWDPAPRLPLGDARGLCSRVPGEAADAVRFSVIRDAGGRVRIVWIIEKDHSPVEFGTLEYADGSISAAAPLLAAQATAFVRGYLA